MMRTQHNLNIDLDTHTHPDDELCGFTKATVWVAGRQELSGEAMGRHALRALAFALRNLADRLVKASYDETQ